MGDRSPLLWAVLVLCLAQLGVSWLIWTRPAPPAPTETSSAPEPISSAVSTPPRVDEHTRLSLPATGFDEAVLRRIVREELARQLPAPHTEAAAQEEPVFDPVREAELEQLAATLSQAIEEFVLLGEISPQDMAHLQTEMARLDPQRRHQLLQQLSRAMNSGQLKGRF